jgi:hypothetical protein
MVLTKSQFYELKSVKSLPSSEKKSRWRDYQAKVKSGYKPPRPKRPEKRSSSSSRPHISQPHLSQCADDYLMAAVDPFRYNRPTLPCIPDNVMANTQRIRCRAFGTGFIGTAGFGFVSVYHPCGVASDAACGVYSNASYAGTTVVAPTTGAIAFYTDSPVINASYGTTLKQWRVVGSALRVQYTGTELNKSGICIPLTTGAHIDLTATSLTNATAYRNDAPLSFANRKWHKVSLVNPTPDFQGGAPSTFSDVLFCIMVSGVAGESFQFQVVTYAEVAGVNLSNPIPSESDANGLAAVSTAMAKTALVKAGDWTYNKVKQVALDYVKSSIVPYSGVDLGLSRNSMRIMEAMGDP